MTAIRELCAASVRVGVVALERVHECADLDVRDDLREERISDMPRAVALAEFAARESRRYAGLLNDAEATTRVERFSQRVADVQRYHATDVDRLHGCGPTVQFHAMDAAKHGLDAAEYCETGRPDAGRWGWEGAYPMPE